VVTGDRICAMTRFETACTHGSGYRTRFHAGRSVPLSSDARSADPCFANAHRTRAPTVTSELCQARPIGTSALVVIDAPNAGSVLGARVCSPVILSAHPDPR